MDFLILDAPDFTSLIPNRRRICSKRKRLGQHERSARLHQKGESALDQSQSSSFLSFSSLKGRASDLTFTILFQVYLVLASQLIVTTAIISVFTFV